jgi:hypothetical protein
MLTSFNVLTWSEKNYRQRRNSSYVWLSSKRHGAGITKFSSALLKQLQSRLANWTCS